MGLPKPRPILRWHGGKWMLAPWIISNMPAHRQYVEPFGGGASVLLRKPRAYGEVYNDLDKDVVNLFRVLRDPAKAADLRERLKLTPFARDEFFGAYEQTADPVEQARFLIIRSFMGFGSNACNVMRTTGFRSNSNRSGTTPAHDWANYPDCLQWSIERLSGVVIENKDAFDLIPQHDREDTLFYVDPPYVHATRKKGQLKNYAFELDDEQHERLADILKSVKGMVMLSGYPHQSYERLYKGWHKIERAALADGASKRIECLWLNPTARRMAQEVLL